MERSQVVNELHKPARKNFPRRRVITKGIDDLWQADLVELGSYHKQNNNYRFLLVVIDTFSKFSWVSPLKNKTADEISKTFREILVKTQRSPKHLQTDMGKEFYNSKFKQLMQNYNINHYSSFSSLKASIVERLNRTIKQRMWKIFSYRGSFKWIDIIQKIVDEYNRSKHRTIKMAPIDVTKSNENFILKYRFNYGPKLGQSKFKKGDYVRVSKYKSVFDKGYTANWSTEIFQVADVKNKIPVTYLLKDYQNQPIAGRFYEYELQKTEHPDIYLVEKILKTKPTQLYVKWLGFNDTHNSWISKNNFI